MFSWEQALTSLLLIKLLSRYLAVTLLTYFYFLPRSFSHLFRSSTICYFNLVPRVLFYPSLRSERGRETLVGSGHVSPSPKLILREEYFVSQFFVCFFVGHHTVVPSFRFHRSCNDCKSKLDLLTLQL